MVFCDKIGIINTLGVFIFERQVVIMIYNEFQDIRLSALGMGNMRLPVIDGDDSRIDLKASEEIIDYCMSKGINYYDTAWGYHSGNSELVVGDLL